MLPMVVSNIQENLQKNDAAGADNYVCWEVCLQDVTKAPGDFELYQGRNKVYRGMDP